HPLTPVYLFAWTSNDGLVVGTGTASVHFVNADEGSARRVLDDRLFEVPTEGDPMPRPPRVVGIIPGEPDCVWVEGVSYATHRTEQETGPFSGSDDIESTDAVTA